MSPSAPPPLTGDRRHLVLAGRPVDLWARALVAAVVPPPRFGREGEVLAAVTAARDGRADLADVSLEPRLVGAAARAGVLPVCARVADAGAAAAAHAAGAALVLVPPALAADAAAAGWTAAVVVGAAAELPGARRAAEAHGLPLALDAARLTGSDALVEESVALTAGCRVVRTADVRRTRRVVEVVAALVEARGEAPDGRA